MRHTHPAFGERLLHQVLVAEPEGLLVRLARDLQRFPDLGGDFHPGLPQTAHAIDGAGAQPVTDFRDSGRGIGEEVGGLEIITEMPPGEIGEIVHRRVGHAQHRGPLFRESTCEEWHFAGKPRGQHQHSFRHGAMEQEVEEDQSAISLNGRELGKRCAATRAEPPPYPGAAR